MELLRSHALAWRALLLVAILATPTAFAKTCHENLRGIVSEQQYEATQEILALTRARDAAAQRRDEVQAELAAIRGYELDHHRRRPTRDDIEASTAIGHLVNVGGIIAGGILGGILGLGVVRPDALPMAIFGGTFAGLASAFGMQTGVEHAIGTARAILARNRAIREAEQELSVADAAFVEANRRLLAAEAARFLAGTP